MCYHGKKTDSMCYNGKILIGTIGTLCLLIGTFSKKTLPYIYRMLKVAERSSQQDVSFIEDVVKITNTEAATISVL